MSKYKGTKVQIPGAVSFNWQPLFTILRTSVLARFWPVLSIGIEKIA